MPTLRDARLSDAPAIAGLLAELGYPAAADAVTRRLEALLPRPDYAVCLAALDGEVCGLACAHVVPVIHADEPLALITALVVSERARGGGMGRRLVERLEEFARSHGCARVAVTTASHRSDAHLFYERLGYSLTGRRYVKQPL
jgi:GNAT superfamily N-acetyltransferase